MPRYDGLLDGGRVLDSANARDGLYDIGILPGQIDAMEALTALEMASKLSCNPARMFGFTSKGHLSPGLTLISPRSIRKPAPRFSAWWRDSSSCGMGMRLARVARCSSPTGVKPPLENRAWIIALSICRRRSYTQTGPNDTGS